MSKYVESLVGDKGTILIEITDEVSQPIVQADVVKASPPIERVTKRAREAFDQVLEITRMVAIELTQKLEYLPDYPDEVEFGFGLKLDGSAEVLVAKAGAEAQFEVKLKWEKDRDRTSD
jgi:hypothetical protein